MKKKIFNLFEQQHSLLLLVDVCEGHGRREMAYHIRQSIHKDGNGVVPRGSGAPTTSGHLEGQEKRAITRH